MIRIAIVENIAEQKQTPSAQKGVIEYCMQPQKTQADERTVYVSGVNCVPELVSESFLATQNLYGHEPDGVRFYHYVQSFSPSENVTPELAHRIALELASYFGNREVLVATHLDSDHLHSHFVIDSYDIDSGKKLHMNKFTLADLRNQSDALCMKYGLSVLPQYDPKVKSTNLRPREYRAAMKGESWKMRLCAEIDEVMRYARTENEFKKLMRRRGYGVIWEPGRKYITYVVGENKRVRDIRLHETKYEKRCMEYEFRIREKLFGIAQAEESAAGVGAEANSTTENGTAFRGGMGTADDASLQFTDARQLGMGGGECARGDTEGNGKGDGRVPPEAERTDFGDGESRTEDGEFLPRTGWEPEREVLLAARTAAVQERNQGRDSVHGGNAGTRVGAVLNDLAWFGSDLSRTFEDEEDPEERRKRIEAEENGAALGAAVGLILGGTMALSGDEEDETEDTTEYAGPMMDGM